MKKYKKGEPIKSLEELMEQEFIIHKIGATEKTVSAARFGRWVRIFCADRKIQFEPITHRIERMGVTPVWKFTQPTQHNKFTLN